MMLEVGNDVSAARLHELPPRKSSVPTPFIVRQKS